MYQALTRNKKYRDEQYRACWTSGAPSQSPSQHKRVNAIIKVGMECYKALRVDKGCSPNFHREVICYFNLQGLEGDSWQMRDREGRFQKKKPPFSLRKWIQGIVNNVTTGKRSHNGWGKKECQERTINETKTEWRRILVRKWQIRYTS